jgi:hypothetical protein
MKIQVVRVDGRIEILTLVGPVISHEGIVGGLSSLETITGTTHFFRQHDGAYDGWSMNCGSAFKTKEEVLKFIDAVERDREIHER